VSSPPLIGGKALVIDDDGDVANRASNRARAIDLLVERLLLARGADGRMARKGANYCLNRSFRASF
jgi:hypothetical protein